MASLGFDGVGKVFPGGTIAVSRVSIDLADGEFVVLVGPSGCGKSTLLRMAAGLEVPDAGRVLLGGRDVTGVAPEDRDVAMVFQNYALYPHMTVRDNLAFGLEQRRMPKPEIERLVREAAAMLDLGGLLQRRPGALSGGQRQRVAMGRAIVRHPAAFLMDEPLSNLDAKLRVQMRGELKLLNARLGVTTLYVTHDQVEAMTMGDRVAVLKPVRSGADSNLQQLDTPQALYDRPANLFVAGFIGSPAMNFFHARVDAEDGRLTATLAGTGIRLPVAGGAALSAYAGRDAILGIRPEAFRVVDPATAPIAAEVLVTEALGADSFVFFDLPTPRVDIEALGEDPALLAPGRGSSRVTARVLPEQAPGPGERLPLGVDPAKLHWFDPATGQAIRA